MLKEKNFLEDITSYSLKKFKELGTTESEVACSHSITEEIQVRNGKFEEIKKSDEISLGLTAYFEKKKSSISISNLSKDRINYAIQKCVDMAKNTPEDKFCGLADPNFFYKNHNEELSLYDENTISYEKKESYIKECENEALKKKEIFNSNGASFSEIKSNFFLQNSNGFGDGYKTSYYSVYCDVIAKKNGSMERDYEISSKRYFNDLPDAKKIGDTAATRSIKKLNSKKIKSFNGDIILEPRIASSLLAHFIGSISGHNLARKVSFIKGEVGESIFNEEVNIIDDPKIPRGLGTKKFDNEGVRCQKLNVIINGKLNEIFLDTYSAKMLNKKTNGRSSGATNFFVNNGKSETKDLIKDIRKGVYITDLFGSGFNSVTGDFSKGGSGFLIENGEIKYPINEITIASNILHMFKNLTLGNDLELKYRINSPTIKISNVSIGGV